MRWAGTNCRARRPFQSDRMREIALVKAREHLELAKAAAQRLTLEAGFKPYEQAWSDFLSQASRFYSKLEQGAKGCNASEPWLGLKKHERRTDTLLAFLHHARNSDEHGLEQITQRAADGINMRFPPAQRVAVGMDVMLDDEGRLHVRNPQVRLPEGQVERIEIVNPRVELIPVTDRGRRYEPPRAHLDRPIEDRSPRGVAQLAIAHLEAILAEASELPQRV